MALSTTELVKSGDKICIYNTSKSSFIQLDSHGRSSRAVWIISSNDKIIRANSVITLLDSAGGRYLSCKYISTQPSYWIVMLAMGGDTALINSFSAIKFICQCHKRILQYAHSADEFTQKAGSWDIWRIVHSDRLRVGIFASHLPKLLTTPTDIDGSRGNESAIYTLETNNFSSDRELETILMSLFYLDCNNSVSSGEYDVCENKKIENFHFTELLNFSGMLKKCASFVEEQIGHRAPSGRVDYVRQTIATQVYNAIEGFYHKLSNVDISCNGMLNLRTALEPEVELFTRIVKLIPFWNDCNTINFMPNDVQTLQNPIYTKIHQSISDAQRTFYSDSSNRSIYVLCDIMGKVPPKHFDKTILDALSRELFSKLDENKNPIATILHRTIKVCHTSKFDTLFPNSYRIKYFAHQALSREITEAKQGLTKVWLNALNLGKNPRDISLLELQNGACLLRWRMRTYLDELDLTTRTRANNLPVVTCLEELIKGYKCYCNALQFDARLYDLIYECLQFSKYFTVQHNITNSHTVNISIVRDGEAKLSELWTNFYKQCAQCTQVENALS